MINWYFTFYYANVFGDMFVHLRGYTKGFLTSGLINIPIHIYC